MSAHLLAYSIFGEILHPTPTEGQTAKAAEVLRLRRNLRMTVDPLQQIHTLPLVVFDIETTGLDHDYDSIIEIGAQKLVGQKVVAEYSTLINPGIPLPPIATKISGITDEMLVGQKTISEVLPEFFDFIKGSVLVAHNASFDLGFIKVQAAKLGYDIDWPSFCTLKLARALLPQLERKTLDSLAEHYELSFEARHRSIGDVKVTVAVLHELLEHEGVHLKNWTDIAPYRVA